MLLSEMSFRERSAWAMGALFLAITLFYVAQVQPVSWRSGSAPPAGGVMIRVTLISIVGAIVIQSVLASRSPREASAPADERERLLLTRASHWAGLVLGAGCIMALWNYMVHANGDLMFHGILLSLLVSTVVEYALQILYFRRGL